MTTTTTMTHRAVLNRKPHYKPARLLKYGFVTCQPSLVSGIVSVQYLNRLAVALGSRFTFYNVNDTIFVSQMSKIPYYTQRLKAMLFRSQFDDKFDEIKPVRICFIENTYCYSLVSFTNYY